MRAQIASDKRNRFVQLVGQGMDPYEAFQLAGFSTSGSEAGWRANCRSLTSKLRREIDAALAANNLPESRKQQTGDLSEEESSALQEEIREALKLAKAQNNVGAQTKLLKQLERLTRRSARGRPPASAPAPSKAKELPRMSEAEYQRVIGLLVTDEEDAEIQRQYPAHIEEERAKWIREEPNQYFEVAFPDMKKRTLADGSTVFDLEAEKSRRNELLSTVSHVALEPPVKRL